MAESRRPPSLPTAEDSGESAVEAGGLHVDPRLLCMAVALGALGALGCIDGTQGTQAERDEDNPHSIVYQPENRGDFAHVNTVVVKGNSIDVFMAVPEGYEGAEINATVTLLRDGSVVESGLRVVAPEENPFSFAFKAAIETGDAVEVTLEGAPTFVMPIDDDASGRGAMPR